MRGLDQVLRQDKPVIVFESHGRQGHESIEFLRTLGYSKFLSINKRVRFGFIERYTIDVVQSLSEAHMYPMIIACRD